MLQKKLEELIDGLRINFSKLSIKDNNQFCTNIKALSSIDDRVFFVQKSTPFIQKFIFSIKNGKKFAFIVEICLFLSFIYLQNILCIKFELEIVNSICSSFTLLN